MFNNLQNNPSRQASPGLSFVSLSLVYVKYLCQQLCCIHHKATLGQGFMASNCTRQTSSSQKFFGCCTHKHDVTNKFCIGCLFNSLAPGRFKFNFRKVIFKLILVNGGWDISYKIALRWMSLDLIDHDDKSTLVQVMAWCRQVTSHYLSQYWPRSVSPNSVDRPQLKHVKRAWISHPGMLDAFVMPCQSHCFGWKYGHWSHWSQDKMAAIL